MFAPKIPRDGQKLVLVAQAIPPAIGDLLPLRQFQYSPKPRRRILSFVKPPSLLQF
jgi:hypothetical protein